MEFLHCPHIHTAFNLLGKRWNGMLIHVLMDGPKRFKELSEIIPGISQKMLAERLKELEASGMLERSVYPETPIKVIYSLTEKGKALESVMKEVQKWGNRYCGEE
ncbi:transcriptional regulator [Bacillus mangrovi]|uniref:Transcriptional regulator n=1 Tax=Metabacillus mangrovi TaxID=1491830 RepID=A0A7X2S2J3_9BACI|nr:winged helix-turn-helix transcriptional regulator [Metabacillus mangrovi]MTH51998.1 transcriptional regulator [Metabacillus mangrovi]